MKIACIGDVGVDYYEKQKLKVAGGIAFNFAYNLASLGEKNVSLAGILGNDQDSKKLLSLINQLGINTSCIQKENGNPPVQNINLKESGERIFTNYSVGVLKKWKLRKGDLSYISKQDAVFVPLSDGMEHIFDVVKKIKGPIKIVDFSQDYEYADLDNKQNMVTKNIKYFDIIFLGGSEKHKKMIEELAAKNPEKVIVLTLGEKGALAFYKNEKHIGSAKKVKVVDTTGCGDAFQAGFVSSFIYANDIGKALSAGANQAAKVIKHIGSTPIRMYSN